VDRGGTLNIPAVNTEASLTALSLAQAVFDGDEAAWQALLPAPGAELAAVATELVRLLVLALDRVGILRGVNTGLVFTELRGVLLDELMEAG
jgi:hypothetical protein